MALHGLSKMSCALVLNPDNWVIGVVTFVIYHCFHYYIRRYREQKNQCGDGAA
jgi:hypothetical protein